MTTPLRQAMPIARRLALTIIVACLAGIGATVATAAPAQAVEPFCDTNEVTYTGVYANAHILMPASSGWQNINCSMSRGATGAGVRALQAALNRCYSGGLTVDGQFGPRTEAALKRAQVQHGLWSNYGRYTSKEAWNLKFEGVRGWRFVCARLDGAMLP